MLAAYLILVDEYDPTQAAFQWGYWVYEGPNSFSLHTSAFSLSRTLQASLPSPGRAQYLHQRPQGGQRVPRSPPSG